MSLSQEQLPLTTVCGGARVAPLFAPRTASEAPLTPLKSQLADPVCAMWSTEIWFARWFCREVSKSKMLALLRAELGGQRPTPSRGRMELVLLKGGPGGSLTNLKCAPVDRRVDAE